MNLISQIFEDPGSPSIFLLRPPHAGLIRVFVLLFILVLFLLKCVWFNGELGSTLGPLTPKSSMPLSMPSVQHHFFVRTPPEL